MLQIGEFVGEPMMYVCIKFEFLFGVGGISCVGSMKIYKNSKSCHERYSWTKFSQFAKTSIFRLFLGKYKVNFDKEIPEFYLRSFLKVSVSHTLRTLLSFLSKVRLWRIAAVQILSQIAITSRAELEKRGGNSWRTREEGGEKSAQGISYFLPWAALTSQT